MSYAGLVLDRQRRHGGEELLDQVVLLGIQRRAAQEVDAQRPLEQLPVLVLLLPGLRTGADHAVGDHVRRLLERDVLPLAASRPAVLDARFPHRAVDHLFPARSLAAQAPPRGRATRSPSTPDTP